MLGRNAKTIIEPTEDGHYLVENVGEYLVTNRTYINVPMGHSAVIVENERILMRIDARRDYPLAEVENGALIDKTIRVYFYDVGSFDHPWGVGKIAVVDRVTGETYYVGAHGDITFRLRSVSAALIKQFGAARSVDSDSIHDALLPILQSVASSVIAEYFRDMNVSYFDIVALQGELATRVKAGLERERAVSMLGICIESLSLVMHISENDMRRISR